MARAAASFAHAAHRFGLGPRAGEAAPADPRAWLLAQIRPLPALPGSTAADALAAIRARRMDGQSDAPGLMARADAALWARRVLVTESPFAERWVAFWANHLTVSRRAGQVTALAAPYEREAIRAHAFGRFEDMLLAAHRHPAMLIYLDNANSVGPGSVAGQRRQLGLNENLARECLELHTVTPEAGYTQDDVRQLARLLTGWSVGRGGDTGEPEGFFFRPRAHEPGAKTLLGIPFEEGEPGGEAALRFLARHPSTHRALARKLARHFGADPAPPGMAARVEAALRDTGGDLAAAARAVVAAPEAWAAPLGRVRSAQDHALAVLRGLGTGEEAAPMLLGTLGRLGQPLWTAPAPNGWADTDAEWSAPEQLMRRLDWAGELAGRAAAAGRVEPAALAELLQAREPTRREVARAGSAREAILLALACPEAMRR